VKSDVRVADLDEQWRADARRADPVRRGGCEIDGRQDAAGQGKECSRAAEGQAL